MDEIEQLKFQLTDVNEGLLIKLRFGKSIDNEIIDQFELIISIVKRISVIYRDEAYLPKELCGIFVDFFPALEGCLPNYDKSEAERLSMYADKLMDLIILCCTRLG